MESNPVKLNIIETASRLFYTNGYNLTGINEIIKEAGIAKATLYHHFRSKDDICLAYLKFKHYKFMKDISTFVNSKKGGKNQILALFDFLLTFFKDKDFNGCWCIKTISEIPKEKEIIRSEIRSQKEQLIEFIQNLIMSNLSITSNIEAKQKAQQIYLLYEGAVGESHLHGKKWPINSAKKLCTALIMD